MTHWTAVNNLSSWRGWKRLPIVIDVNRLIVTEPDELERTRCEREKRSMDEEP